MKTVRGHPIALSLLLAMHLLSAPIARNQTGVNLTGHVLDQTGGIVPGAAVRLYSAEEVRQSRADGDARFDFANLPPNNYDLEATSPGFNSTVIENIEISMRAPEPLSIRLNVGSGGHCPIMAPGPALTSSDGHALPERLLIPGAEISYEKRLGKIDLTGTVRDDRGSPLQNVAVKLIGVHESQSVVSNDKGGFEFSGVGPGKYVLSSSLGGYWDVSRKLWITRGNLTKVKVTLPDKSRVNCFEFSGP